MTLREGTIKWQKMKSTVKIRNDIILKNLPTVIKYRKYKNKTCSNTIEIKINLPLSVYVRECTLKKERILGQLDGSVA